MTSKAIGGKWLASKITDAKIAELWSSGYILADVACRAPPARQVIPTPNPGERVVFVPHFLRGLGFPLHPFLRGLLFYYGLDFHDLAPNSIFHITTFIIFCEVIFKFFVKIKFSKSNNKLHFSKKILLTKFTFEIILFLLYF